MMRHSTTVILGLVPFFAMASCESAQAWGVVGHTTIGILAEQQLTPTARRAVESLLALEDHQHLSEVAVWADEWRATHPETGPWHYLDIPISETHYDPTRDCPKDECIIPKINEFVAILQDATKPAQDRLIALKYVVHFVGDIHQPLHAGENHDKGGNGISVKYDGQIASGAGKYKLTLHGVWDTTFIDRKAHFTEGPGMTQESLGTASEDLAKTLRTAIRQDPQWTATGLDPVLWAVESHDLARDVAYAGIVGPGAASPDPNDVIALDQAYADRAWPVIERQLVKAGARLANTLNKALTR